MPYTKTEYSPMTPNLERVAPMMPPCTPTQGNGGVRPTCRLNDFQEKHSTRSIPSIAVSKRDATAPPRPLTCTRSSTATSLGPRKPRGHAALPSTSTSSAAGAVSPAASTTSQRSCHQTGPLGAGGSERSVHLVHLPVSGWSLEVAREALQARKRSAHSMSGGARRAGSASCRRHVKQHNTHMHTGVERLPGTLSCQENAE